MAEKGLDILISVNTGTVETPTWTVVGGQRGAELSRSADTFDSTSKASEGWKEFEAGFKEWSIETDGLLIESDEGLVALEEAYMNSEKVKVQFASTSGAKYSGLAVVSSFPISAPYDDLVTYTCSLTGAGKLEKGK